MVEKVYLLLSLVDPRSEAPPQFASKLNRRKTRRPTHFSYSGGWTHCQLNVDRAAQKDAITLSAGTRVRKDYVLGNYQIFRSVTVLILWTYRQNLPNNLIQAVGVYFAPESTWTQAVTIYVRFSP